MRVKQVGKLLATIWREKGFNAPLVVAFALIFHGLWVALTAIENWLGL